MNLAQALDPKRSLRCGIAIALTWLSGTAFGQDYVRIVGMADVSVGRFQLAGTKPIAAVQSGQMWTSYWGINTMEHFGNGYSTETVLEDFFRFDTGQYGRYDGDDFWSRNAFLGVNSPYGTFRIGRISTLLFESSVAGNAFANSFIYSPVQRQTFLGGAVESVQGDTTWNHAVSYRSPDINGYTAKLLYSLGQGVGGDNASGQVGYSDETFGVMLTAQSVKTGLPVGKEETAVQLATTYDAGFAKGYASLIRIHDSASGTRTTGYSVGTHVPVGTNAVLAQWGRSDVTGSVSRQHTSASLAYEIIFSKRTDIYFVGMRDQISGTNIGTSFSVGLQQKF